MALLAKARLNSIVVLISKAFIDSYTRHDEFVSVNNLLRENDYMKKAIENPENPTVYQTFEYIYKTSLFNM